MSKFFLKYVFRSKNHLLYAAAAQIVLLTINVLIFLSSSFDIPYTVFQSVVPTYLYLVFIVLFYLLIDRLNRKYTAGQLNRKATARSVISAILNYTIVVANVIYTLITTFDESGVLYYLDTVIIQTFNAFYLVVYIAIFGKQYARRTQLNLLNIFSYTAAVTAMLSFYFCFVNMMVAWVFIIVTTTVLFITYMIMHENYKRSLPKKKVLLSRAKMKKND